MPITENFAIPKEEGKTYEVLPADIYQAQLIDVNVELNPDYNDKTKMVKNFSFLFAVIEEPNIGRWLTYRFVPTTLFIGRNGKNKLYQITEALMGRELTMEDENHFDANFVGGLVGEQIRLGVKVKVTGEKKTNIIDAVYPIKVTLNPMADIDQEKMREDYAEAQKKWKENATEPVEEKLPVIQQETEEDIKVQLDSIPY